jgi:hypothetical protein
MAAPKKDYSRVRSSQSVSGEWGVCVQENDGRERHVPFQLRRVSRIP